MSSSVPSTPNSRFSTSEPPASTEASSPPPTDLELKHCVPAEEEIEVDTHYARLSTLLSKAAIFTNILKMQMDENKERQQQEYARQRDAELINSPGKGKKRGLETAQTSGSKRRKGDESQVLDMQQSEQPPIFKQPSLVTGAKLKDYQLEGLQWMMSLHKNGISGILADEMGLGKTLQTIAFNAFLREEGFSLPFMIVCPLSVLHNWVEEFGKFAPSIPVCMYHGTPAERAELRRTVMLPPQFRRKAVKVQPKKTAKSNGKEKVHPARSNRNRRKSGRQSKRTEEEEDNSMLEAEDVPKSSDYDPSFPVVITTYEMIIKDRAQLAGYNFGYIVVDEGHRLKNLDCRLIREIKKYNSAGRMILTGTPLHNNLSELWALLNFVLPDVFTDLDSFQAWFDIPTMQQTLGSERATRIIDNLHAILKPFLLRRLKADVMASLPPKKEYVLYAPLSVQQRDMYDKIVQGTLREHLIGRSQETQPEKKASLNEPRTTRSKNVNGKKRKSYAVDGDDDEYFEMLERGEVDERGVIAEGDEDDLQEMSRKHLQAAVVKHVKNMKLQNTIMQLRKICSHPFLFDWPLDPRTQEPILNEKIVDASGKMMVLDRLLEALFKEKHKVLLFSQFTTMLDLIDDWARELKGWNICRIDGSTPPLERREQMNLFQTAGDTPNAPSLFLLSTRAGGLGINLTAADTVIFYDQDWNPQMDAQAQDRAHRIGQTKPVLIFRLVSAHTVETKIMQKATEKKKLEALVIAKGKFKMPSVPHARRQGTMAEMAAALLQLEGEKIEVVSDTKEGKRNVLSDVDLDMLLDRRPEVFIDRGVGWTSDGTGLEQKTATFAVYEAPVNEGSEALAKIMGEDVE